MSKSSRAAQKNNLLWASIVFTVLLVLISASFQNFFFLSPSTTYPVLGFFQTLYTTTWFVLVGVPPIILIVAPFKGLAVRIWLTAAAAIFPIAVLCVHATLASIYGNPYIDYLGTYPILLVSHLLIPAAYIVLFWRGISGEANGSAASSNAPSPAEQQILWPAVVEPAPHDNNWQPTEVHHY